MRISQESFRRGISNVYGSSLIVLGVGDLEHFEDCREFRANPSLPRMHENVIQIATTFGFQNSSFSHEMAWSQSSRRRQCSRHLRPSWRQTGFGLLRHVCKKNLLV